MRQTEDPEATDFEPPGQRLGRSRDEAAVINPQDGLVVGDQGPAGIDQAQRQVGLARPGGPPQQQPDALDHDASGVNQAVRHGICGQSSGRRTRNRAPTTAPSEFRRFSAAIWPPRASTICLEIDRPSPEWVPNFSSLGRSL